MVKLPTLPAGYDFHHIGYATTSIDREQGLLEFLGYRQESKSFVDLVQGISGCFLIGLGPRIELLENLPESQTLTPWLNAGIKMYHLAYWVDSIDTTIEWVRSQRAKVIVQPVSAIAFGGRRISFVMFRNGLMLEFIEKALLVKS